MDHSFLVLVALSLFAPCANADEAARPATYCNPLDLDYGYCPIPDFVADGKHRATADPAVARFRGAYYLFATNQGGYWRSEDLARWEFFPRGFLTPANRTLEGRPVYDDLCAPALLVRGGALHVIGSTYTEDFTLWRSERPERNEWSPAVEHFRGAAWDPALFEDDDGRVYLYNGSGNDRPLYGRELDRETLQPLGPPREVLWLDDARHGWERFGEANDNTWLRPFVEGAWMTKHTGRYYLQYAAPGTEFSGYADGVAVGDSPLGPFERQAHNPVCYQPGGYARGAGHGCTFDTESGQLWRMGTIAIGVKNNFERRLGMWPASFDADGVMRADTAYGDLPRYLPSAGAELAGKPTGWMPLHYAKPVRASSAVAGRPANFAVDEDIRTYWSAESGDAGESLTVDLGGVCDLRAVQVNFADHRATLMGKPTGLRHRFRVEASSDGETWETIVDRSTSDRDTPHAYAELASPVAARLVRVENLEVPTGAFALGDLRVFGRGRGAPPAPVENLRVYRGPSEPRNALLKWRAAEDAFGYVVRAGVSPDKLYSAMTVLGDSECYFRAMDRDRDYYFTIEPFSENGVGPASEPVAAPVPAK